MFIDPLYFLYIAPAVLLGVWAQSRVRSRYARASQVPSRLSGAAVARHLLDSAGLHNVGIEPIPGQLTDHYDPRSKVLRLSHGVYASRNLAAAGIAAHEAGHAIQDAERYTPLVLRNLAVPLASNGSSLGMLLLIVGLALSAGAGGGLGGMVVLVGILLFAGTVVFQLINLPVEFDASRRAKQQLVEFRIVSPSDMKYVNGVLNAAAWTYVAGTLQAILTLVYLLRYFRGGSGE